MVTLLLFVRDNRVVGTQSTGNMPLKAIRDLTAHFVKPPQLETKIGGKIYRLRSEEDLWLLHFLHILADIGGLIEAAPSKRWRLTNEGGRFLETDPMLQLVFLLAVWWYNVNWLVAYSFVGMGDTLPRSLPHTTLDNLSIIPVETYTSFVKFSDRLIADTKLTWRAQNSSFAATALRGSIERMVIDVLATFGAVKCRYRKDPLGKGTISILTEFKITSLGAIVLKAMVALGN